MPTTSTAGAAPAEGSTTVTTVVARRTPPVVLVVCTALMVFEGYDIFSYGVVVPALLARPDWALTPAHAGLIGSAGVFGILVGTLVSGFLTDRFGRKAIIVGAVLAFSAGMTLCALAPTPGTLLACRVLVGLGTGGFLPTVLTFVVESSPASRRTFNVALASAGVAAGGAAAALLGTLLLPALGYRAVFLVGLVPLVVLLPVVVTRLPESVAFLVASGRTDHARAAIARHHLPIDVVEAEVPAGGAEGPRMLGTRAAVASLFTRGVLGGTLVFWVGDFLCMVLIFGANTWLPAIMIRAGYGLTSSLAFLAALNVGVLVSLGSAALARHRSPKPYVLVGFAACAASLALLAAVRPPVVATFLLVVLVGFGAGGNQNLINAYLASFYRPSHRGTGVGLALGVGRLGGILGPLYGGLVLAGATRPSTSFVAFLVPAALALGVFALGPRIVPAPGDRPATAH